VTDNILKKAMEKIYKFSLALILLFNKNINEFSTRVHLFGPGSIQKISEPQGKKTASGELQSKAEAKALWFFLVRVEN